MKRFLLWLAAAFTTGVVVSIGSAVLTAWLIERGET